MTGRHPEHNQLHSFTTLDEAFTEHNDWTSPRTEHKRNNAIKLQSNDKNMN